MNNRRLIKQAIVALNKTKNLYKSESRDITIDELNKELFKHPAQKPIEKENNDQSAADDHLDYLHSQY